MIEGSFLVKRDENGETYVWMSPVWMKIDDPRFDNIPTGKAMLVDIKLDLESGHSQEVEHVS